MKLKTILWVIYVQSVSIGIAVGITVVGSLLFMNSRYIRDGALYALIGSVIILGVQYVALIPLAVGGCMAAYKYVNGAMEYMMLTCSAYLGAVILHATNKQDIVIMQIGGFGMLMIFNIGFLCIVKRNARQQNEPTNRNEPPVEHPNEQVHVPTHIGCIVEQPNGDYCIAIHHTIVPSVQVT